MFPTTDYEKLNRTLSSGGVESCLSFVGSFHIFDTIVIFYEQEWLTTSQRKPRESTAHPTLFCGDKEEVVGCFRRGVINVVMGRACGSH